MLQVRSAQRVSPKMENDHARSHFRRGINRVQEGRRLEGQVWGGVWDGCKEEVSLEGLSEDECGRAV